jgi:serine/threonine protein kinase
LKIIIYFERFSEAKA